MLIGQKAGEAGETFTLGKCLYAVDAGLRFGTPADLELGAWLLSRASENALGIVTFTQHVQNLGIISSSSL
jgi:hypothetical protein